jgi:hypothetical protein
MPWPAPATEDLLASPRPPFRRRPRLGGSTQSTMMSGPVSRSSKVWLPALRVGEVYGSGWPVRSAA